MKTLLLVFLSLGLFSCNDTSSTSIPEEIETSETPTFKLEGKWLTECMNFGGGNLNQIYVIVDEEGANSLAILTWDTLGCTGTYTMSWNSAPITEPAHAQNLSSIETTGIAENFDVVEVETIGFDDRDYVVVFYEGEDVFYELVIFEDLETDWDDWQTVTDVAGFVADPENFTPTTYQKFKFNRVEALP